MKTLLKSYPAYDVFSKKDGFNITHLLDGEKIIQKDHLSKHMIGSVASYAVKNGDCPYASRDRAIKNGHDLYYIFALGSCLTSHKQEKKKYIEVSAGEVIHFEGHLFEIIKQNNNNLGLEILCSEYEWQDIRNAIIEHKRDYPIGKRLAENPIVKNA